MGKVARIGGVEWARGSFECSVRSTGSWYDQSLDGVVGVVGQRRRVWRSYTVLVVEVVVIELVVIELVVMRAVLRVVMRVAHPKSL